MSENIVTLSAVGDIVLTGQPEEVLIKYGYLEYFKDIISKFKNSDLIFGNLECPVTSGGKALKKTCCLSCSSFVIKALKNVGFNVFSLANNHIFDYSWEGFKETVSLLEKIGIHWFGAGKNLKEARRPLILSVNGITIGFLGYAWDFIGAINATNHRYGTAPLSSKLIIKDVKKLSLLVDIVIVSLHWGYEKEYYPLPSQRKLAYKIIDYGASVVLGHHPHVLQGIERYKNGIIVYSLGNFIFPDIQNDKCNIKQKPENKTSIIFQCKLSKSGVEDFNFVPIYFDDEQLRPVILRNKKKKTVIKKIEKLSECFNIKNYDFFWKYNRTRKDIPDVFESFKLYSYIIKKIVTKVKEVLYQVVRKLLK